MGLCSSTNQNRNIKSNLKNNKNNKKKVNFSQKITIKTQNTLKKKSNSNSIEHTNIKLYSFKNYKIFNENIHFSKGFNKLSVSWDEGTGSITLSRKS